MRNWLPAPPPCQAENSTCLFYAVEEARPSPTRWCKYSERICLGNEQGNDSFSECAEPPPQSRKAKTPEEGAMCAVRAFRNSLNRLCNADYFGEFDEAKLIEQPEMAYAQVIRSRCTIPGPSPTRPPEPTSAARSAYVGGISGSCPQANY